MEIKITVGKADFNNSKFGNNKEVVIVEFPNCISTKTNKSFKWMPTYKQLEDIHKALKYIERKSWGDEELNQQEDKQNGRTENTEC